MSFLKWISVGVSGVLLGMVIGWSVSARAKARLQDEIQALQARCATAQQRAMDAASQSAAWKSQAEQLRADADEVHRLRAEISRLQNETLTKKSTGQTSDAAVPVQTQIQPAPASKRNKFAEGTGTIAFENLPPVVGTTFLREMQTAPTNGVYLQERDEKTFYVSKGRMPDGRGISLVVGEDGTVTEKSSEIETTSVPERVQAAVSQNFAGLPVVGAHEIFENGNTRYELTAKGAESAMQITVDSDGTVLSYSAKLRSPNDRRGKP